MKRSLITLTIISAFLALYLIGCGGGDGVSTISPVGTNSDGKGTISMEFVWPETSDLTAQLIPTNTSKINVIVTKDGTQVGTTEVNPPVAPAKTVSASISAPLGNIQLEFRAVDAGGNLLSHRIKKLNFTSSPYSLGNVYLGVTIQGNPPVFVPQTIPVTPGDVLYWGNNTDKVYSIMLNINGTNVGPLKVDPNSEVSYDFKDTSISGDVAVSLYEGPSGTGPSVASSTLSVQVQGGTKYTAIDRWGELSTGSYDAVNGWSFVTVDSLGNFFVAFYNPYDVFNQQADRNLIQKFNSDGIHQPISFETSRIKQILGVTVDDQGKWLYVSCFEVGTTATVQVPNVFRFDAQAGGTPRTLEYGLVTPAVVNLLDRNFYGNFATFTSTTLVENEYPVTGQGLAIGYNTTTKNPQYLYVVDGKTPSDIAAAPYRIGRIHRFNIENFDKTGSAAINWDEAGSGYPAAINIQKQDAGIELNRIRPVDIAVSHESGVLFVVGFGYDDTTEPVAIATGGPTSGAYVPIPHNATTNPIRRYAVGAPANIAQADLKFNPGSTPRVLSSIELHTSPSVATTSHVYVVTADQYAYTARPNPLNISAGTFRGEDVYIYDGSSWSLFVADMFTVPVADDFSLAGIAGGPTNLTTGYVPYLIGANFTNTALVGYENIFASQWLDSAINAVIDTPPAPAYECASDVAFYAGYVPANDMTAGVGLLPANSFVIYPSLSIAVSPNNSENVFVGDYFHHVSKYNKNATLANDWRLPYDSFAYPFDVESATGAEMLVSDAGNCRVIRMGSAGTSDYKGQFGFPVFQANPILVNARIMEFNAPLGVALGPSGSVYVVDRDRNPNADLFLNNGDASVASDHRGFRGRVQEFASTAGTAGFGPSATVQTKQWFKSTRKDFFFPTGIAVDSGNDIYVCDTGDGPQVGETGWTNPNGTGSAMGCVQRMGTDGSSKILYTGSTNTFPTTLTKGVAIDQTGATLYVSDFMHRVLLYDLAHQSSTCTGQIGTTSGGGGVTDGEFQNPTGIHVDGSRYVYVCDSKVSPRVQKFNPSTSTKTSGGWVSTFGVGDTLLLYGVTTSTDGSRVYVGDRGQNRIRIYAAQK